MIRELRTKLASFIAPRQAAPATDERLWQTGYPMAFTPGVNTTGVAVTSENALTYTAFWRCVTLIAGHCMILPWKFDRPKATGRGREDVQVPVVSDWIANGPNAQMAWGSFVHALTMHGLSWGNGYAEILRRRTGQVIGLELLTPNRVRPLRLSDGTIVYRVWPIDGTSQTRVVLAEDMFHFRAPGWDGLVGYSPVQLFMQALGLALSTERYGGSFFGRGGMPAGVLEYSGELPPEDRTRMQEDWQAMYGGSQPVSRVAILEGGTWKFTPVSIPNDTAQFLETRSFQVKEMGRIFGVPGHMLGESDAAPRANVQQASMEYVRDCLACWVKRWRDEFNRQILRTEAPGVTTCIDMRELARADDVMRATYHKTMFMIGVESVNDIREDEGEEAIGPEGDQRFVPLNMVPLDQASDLAAAQAAAGSRKNPTGDTGVDGGGPNDPQPDSGDKPAGA